MDAPPAALLDARYRLGPVIARGGMSTVYRGTDTRLDRPVAIKVMDPRLAADPAFRARFEREARSAARIDHPAVVDVHDQGDDPHGPEPVLFLVMELVEGGTLRDVLRARGAIGVPAAIAVLDPVLSGLAEAHRLGLVHRDVKPENVLISYTAEVKVADFGLVTAVAQAGASHVGMIMGTVAYLAPEQVATGRADTRSDVYAAGVLLYELLTGEPPYSGDTAISVAYQHVNSRVPPPSLIAGDVPPELDDLVHRATRHDPQGRPADAATMLAELREVAHLLEVPRVPAPVPARAPVDDQDTVPGGRAIPGPLHTRALPQPDGPPEAPEPAHLQARRRSRRFFAAGIALVVVLTMLVALAAWWLGTGRWTAMPSLVGVEQSVAQQLLAEADLVPGAVTQIFDDAAPTGAVTTTNPPADTRLLRGTTVTLTVSSGRPTVPAIAAGTAAEEAERVIRDAGLTPVRSTSGAEFSAAVPEGAVVRTDPGAGAALSIGGPVTIVLSRGPEPERVRVPFVIGQDFDAAEELLDDLDLDAEERATFPFGHRGNGTVLRQSPGAGSLVDPGTTVVLETI